MVMVPRKGYELEGGGIGGKSPIARPSQEGYPVCYLGGSRV